MDFSWAENYPDLYKTCNLFELHELTNPTRFSYKPLMSVKQDGPQCGLVALAMCCKSPSTELVKSLFESAKSKCYTFNGEMFSANDMADLAKEVLPKETIVRLHSGSLATKYIKERLLKGDILLVPYDNDANNGPCLRKGHSAHWAVVSGAVETNQDFYVIARHGVTRSLLIWKLIDLALSNAQLFQFSPKRVDKNLKYKLPEGGIAGPLGLNCKAVILSNL